MSIRAAYSVWPLYNRRLREVVGALSDEQLALRPSPERWPIWATVGHTACQRVFWLCVFAGEPGAETTPFPDSGHSCPGDEDLENFLDGAALAGALDSSFRIVERCLDRWTWDGLAEEVRLPSENGGPDRVHTRGWVLQRIFSHDVYHCAELNEALGALGLPQIDLWG
jgi:uncharacterized damage-inducible protein DinB